MISSPLFCIISDKFRQGCLKFLKNDMKLITNGQ